MSNIQKAFEKGKAFIPFITCGDPSIAITEELIYAMQKAGTDFIILGIPFSDPTAESDVVQSANLRALTNGITTDKIFDMITKIRQNTDIGIIFMTYANVVFSYGSEKFISKSAELGIDSLIVTDLPFEEKMEFLPLCKEYNINLISLIAPTYPERITSIAKQADGFIYCVSSSGVMGINSNIITDISDIITLIKESQNIPCVVSSGIATPHQIAEIVKKADGIIIDSAIVEICEKYGNNCVKYALKYIQEIKQAILK